MSQVALAEDRDREADAPQRSVLHRAASIMEAFTDVHRVLSLNELSRRSRLPRSTAHRFAEQLLELGWLEREMAGYRVGMRLFEFGGLAERRNKLRDKAIIHLHALASHTGMAVNLAILDDGQVLYLERLPLPSLRLPTRDGGRMPATCTALGKALLAFGSPDAVDEALALGLPRLTRSSIITPAAFADELERVRSDGVAYDRGESCEGISCAAVPIRGSGRAIAAISVSTDAADAIDDRATVVAIRRAADVIWADLFPRPRYAR